MSRRRLGGAAGSRLMWKLRLRHVLWSVVSFGVLLLTLSTMTLRLQQINASTSPTDHQRYLSLEPYLSNLQHRPGIQYTLSFRRRNGQWKNPIKEWTSLQAEDLRDLDLASHSLASLDDQRNHLTQVQYVLDLLAAAGVTHVDPRVAQVLPTWTIFSRLYGDSASPIVHGMEVCSSLTPNSTYVGVAGLFNTGTTALELYLRENLMLPSFLDQTTLRKEVPWGKHRLWSLRQQFIPKDMTTQDIHKVLPVVIIRDPFTWMQSMCTSPYMAKWPHTPAHCPNLVANVDDVVQFPQLKFGELISTVLTAQNQTEFATLLDLWIEWYAQYLFSPEPRLLVRFEDVLRSPDAVLEQIRQCLHLQYRHDDHFTYLISPIKWDQKHVKKQSSLVSALIKHGNGWGRTVNLTAADWQVIHQKLSHGAGKALVSRFQYLVGE